jgi:hypothetical protein
LIHLIVGCPGTGKSTYIEKRYNIKDNLNTELGSEESNQNTKSIFFHFENFVKNLEENDAITESDLIIHLDLLAFLRPKLYLWPLYLSKKLLQLEIRTNPKYEIIRRISETEIIFLMIDYSLALNQYRIRESGKKDKYPITRRTLMYPSKKIVQLLFNSRRVYENINESFLSAIVILPQVKTIKIIKNR